MKWFYKLLVVQTLFISCSSQQKDKPDYYFDLDFFIRKEITFLQSQSPDIRKMVIVNGEQNESVLQPDTGFWRKELAPFIESNINRHALRDSYQVDSIDHLVRYTPLEDTQNLQVKLLEVGRSLKGEISRIKVIRRFKNALSTSELVLEYLPGKGYKVSGEQDVKYVGEEKYQIVTDFLFD